MGVIDRVSQALAIEVGPGQEELLRNRVSETLRLETPWHVDDHARDVTANILGLGPLQDLLDDSEVTDVLVNGHDEVWIDRGKGLEIVESGFESEDHVVTTVERALAPLGLRIDRSAPMVDARLQDGSRLHAVLPPASVDKVLVAIRRFNQRVESISDLVKAGTVSAGQAEHLKGLVEDRRTIVVAGGTGAGKTTLLNVLATVFDPGERVVTIEDAAELRFGGHVVRLEARPPNAEGVGAITLRQLLKSALRLRPDRIVVGEVRGEEAFDLVMALNTGHRGSLTTVHANSPDEALLRLESLALMTPGASEAAVSRQLHSAIDVVVQIEKKGVKRVIDTIEEMR